MRQEKLYQLKITLDGIEPKIWRQVLVSENLSLAKLHLVIQSAMGWWISHLHQFICKGVHYINPVWWDSFAIGNNKDGRRVKLKNLKLKEGDFFTYEYDFGDSWNHAVEVEAIIENAKNLAHPFCLDGARACPPEDSGGISGYKTILKTLRGKESFEKRELLLWLGERFNPEIFSTNVANKKLRHHFVLKKNLGVNE